MSKQDGAAFMKKVTALPPLTPRETKAFQEHSSKVVQYIGQVLPEFGRILIHIRYAVSDERATVAYTDGRTITLCRGFFLLSNREQIGLFIHELMHIVLQHCLRRGSRVPMVHNIAADLIINQMITDHGHSAIKLPEFGIFFRDPPFNKALDDKHVSQWTVESLYTWLLLNLPRTNDPSKGIPVPAGKMPHGAKEGLIERPDGEMDDLRENKELTEDPTESEKWSRIARQAMAGAGSNSLLLKLGALLPNSQVPWNQKLRRIAARALSNNLEQNLFPSRRYLSGAAPYEPSFKPKPGIRRIGVVLDVSGSVFNEEDQLLFSAEMKTLQSRYAAETVVLTVDTQITGEFVLKQQDSFEDIIPQFRGGGGTDLVPGVERLVALNADVIIVLTDLYLSRWPKEPRCPLIWVSNQPLQAPVGETIQIN